MGPVFTVFTATHNRETTLHRVYESLVIQTFRDFEWLIVDDGSDDGTALMIAQWQREAEFPIRYFYQPNAGKHMAFNKGVKLGAGEFFLSIDSDDGCKPYALERFKAVWDSIPDAQRSRFSAVTALAEDQHGQESGSRFPADVLDSDPRELLYRYQPTGDKWGFHRTAVLRQFPFPQVEGLKYVPESIVWCAIGKQFKTRYVNEVLLINYRDEGNANLSTLNLRKAARGFVIRDVAALEGDLDIFWMAPWLFAKRAVNVTRFSLLGGLGSSYVVKMKGLRPKLLVLALAPLGLLMWAVDVLKGR